MFSLLRQELGRPPGYLLTSVPSDTKPRNRWLDGARFKEPPSRTLQFPLDASAGTQMPDFLQADIPLFSARLLNRFHAEGVDNLDAYPAILVDPKSGRQWHDYFAVNIIGIVSCADMDQSEYVDHTGKSQASVAFSKLVIDGRRTCDLLCFRLFENFSSILVHQNVVSKIAVTDFAGLRFELLESVA